MTPLQSLRTFLSVSPLQSRCSSPLVLRCSHTVVPPWYSALQRSHPTCKSPRSSHHECDSVVFLVTTFYVSSVTHLECSHQECDGGVAFVVLRRGILIHVCIYIYIYIYMYMYIYIYMYIKCNSPRMQSTRMWRSHYGCIYVHTITQSPKMQFFFSW